MTGLSVAKLRPLSSYWQSYSRLGHEALAEVLDNDYRSMGLLSESMLSKANLTEGFSGVWTDPIPVALCDGRADFKRLRNGLIGGEGLNTLARRRPFGDRSLLSRRPFAGRARYPGIRRRILG